MANINGCDLPEDLYYFIEKHIWAKPMADGTVRVGMTSVAAKLSGAKLAAVTIRKKRVGKEIPKGKSLAMVESSKFVGPVPAPVTGTLCREMRNWMRTPTWLSPTPTVKAGLPKCSPPIGMAEKAPSQLALKG